MDVGIVRSSVGGLIHTALPVEDSTSVWMVLKNHEQVSVIVDALGRSAKIHLATTSHVLGDWTVQRTGINFLNVSKITFACRHADGTKPELNCDMQCATHRRRLAPLGTPIQPFQSLIDPASNSEASAEIVALGRI
jgi:hypothetical protein